MALPTSSRPKLKPKDRYTNAGGFLCVLQEVIDGAPGGRVVDGDFEANLVADKKFLQTHPIGERVVGGGAEGWVGRADRADIPWIVCQDGFCI